MVIQGTRLGLSSCTPAAFFLLFVLLATMHILLGLLKRNWAFQRGELITIFHHDDGGNRHSHSRRGRHVVAP